MPMPHTRIVFPRLSSCLFFFFFFFFFFFSVARRSLPARRTEQGGGEGTRFHFLQLRVHRPVADIRSRSARVHSGRFEIIFRCVDFLPSSSDPNVTHSVRNTIDERRDDIPAWLGDRFVFARGPACERRRSERRATMVSRCFARLI